MEIHPQEPLALSTPTYLYPSSPTTIPYPYLLHPTSGEKLGFGLESKVGVKVKNQVSSMNLG